MRLARLSQRHRLAQLIYCSIATCPLVGDELTEFLEIPRENNFQKRISSVLIYQNGAFNQVLEGPEHAVSQLIQAIKADPRHHDIILDLYCYVPVREYNNVPLTFLHLQNSPSERTSLCLLEYAGQVLQTISEDVVLSRSS